MVVRVHLRCIPYLVVKGNLSFDKKTQRRLSWSPRWAQSIPHIPTSINRHLIYLFICKQTTIAKPKKIWTTQNKNVESQPRGHFFFYWWLLFYFSLAFQWYKYYVTNISISMLDFYSCTLRGSSCPDPPTSAARVDAGVDCVATSVQPSTFPGAKYRW